MNTNSAVNAFMIDSFPEKEQNERYEKVFGSLFNLAVVPFYWSDLEPEQGKTRFTKESPFIYRRPAPDPRIGILRKIRDHAERASALLAQLLAGLGSE